MVCPRCSTVLVGRFCQRCGLDTQAPVLVCPRCGGTFMGYACAFCGLPVSSFASVPVASAGAGLRAVGSVVWSIALILFLLLLAIEAVALGYTAGLVVDGSLTGGPRYIELYVLAPLPAGVLYDAPPNVFVAYYLFLVASIAAAYVFSALKDGRLTARTFARPISELAPRLEARSAFVATGQLFLAVLLFQVIYLIALALVGFVPDVPTFPGTLPSWYPYYALANASVYEEIVTRWMLMGIPLFMIALLVSIACAFGVEKKLVPAGVREELLGRSIPIWRHLFGGTITRDSPPFLIIAAAVFLVVSSGVFALAHVPGWGWWKFPPTFVAGIALGYLFLRSGILAAILFHFATDFLAVLELLSGDSLEALFLLWTLLIALLALGVFFFAWYFVYAARLVAHFAGARGLTPGAASSAAAPYAGPALPSASPAFPPPPPPIPASAYGSGFVTSVCPRCGGREGRYADGRFTCARCGQVT